ncbi:hypothetical protein COV93_07700 [Candidatus Woesearchaeota archaeon CG11_big_fil_rev_8_21_14_0_20_43_8]|nr:MAG: hypothetical protein COV93_07700 [Candidatus Woesearchaeota archaeon CG11_big_fil_rev_8_21_14_0_20_43_8]PIO05638.1 MAG: hypothetical protein COT47_03925 [Candidatus Woesearchaeota archaeon CG08_land_8_20_14_0_20_43_7]
MALKECNFCDNEVPVNGQCNNCGFVDGMNREPVDDELKRAREVNSEHDYEQFRNIDSLLL